MFSIKGRHYKIKSEGLHVLSLSCGRFDHLSSGCANNKVPQFEARVIPSTKGKEHEAITVDVGVKVSGPWVDD